MQAKFWMCFVEGSRGCSFIHYSELEARTEAERLAGLPENAGNKIFIISSSSYCQAEKIPVIVWYLF